MEISEAKKIELIENAQSFFKEIIIPSHLENFKQLKTVSKFEYNPYLISYIASFFKNNSGTASEAIAKALLYPRVLGTSITTSFGSRLQQYITKFFPDSYGSTTDGIDIEFIDAIDGRKKYCQLKAGPQTINDPDITTICDHFNGIKNLARTNNIPLQTNDMVVGILYGKKMSACYKTINKSYPVYMGAEFWFHITGDPNFYTRLFKAFDEVGESMNLSEEFANTLSKLTADIETNGL